MTKYVILRREGDGWMMTDVAPARSARSALRDVLAGSNEEGEYVAVPERSWRPLKVSVETKTALKFQ